MIRKWWMGKDVEGSNHSLIKDIILEFAWRDWAAPRNTSVRTVCVQAVTRFSRIQFRAASTGAILLGVVPDFDRTILYPHGMGYTQMEAHLGWDFYCFADDRMRLKIMVIGCRGIYRLKYSVNQSLSPNTQGNRTTIVKSASD
jgi:hypothetical protein